MKIKKITSVAALVITLTGCASGLNSIQKREYESFKQNNVLIEEKNLSNGIVLGLLPGGGSFYAREPGFGVVNLLCWPLSILWDPVSGYEGSMAINYHVTKHKLSQDEKKELSALEDKLLAGEIDSKQYLSAKRAVARKYDYESSY